MSYSTIATYEQPKKKTSKLIIFIFVHPSRSIDGQTNTIGTIATNQFTSKSYLSSPFSHLISPFSTKFMLKMYQSHFGILRLCRESNCCLVPSPGDVREEPRRFERHVIEEERIKREQTPIVPTESDENKTETYGSQLSPNFKRPALKTHEEKERSRSRSRSPFVPTESDENKTEAYERSPTLQKAPTNAFSNGSTNVPSNHQ